MELTAEEATIRERLMKRENGVGLSFLKMFRPLHVNLDKTRAITCCCVTRAPLLFFVRS